MMKVDEPVILEGWLKKQGEKGMIKSWKDRYFKQGAAALYSLSLSLSLYVCVCVCVCKFECIGWSLNTRVSVTLSVSECKRESECDCESESGCEC